MQYSIKIADINDPVIDLALRNLIKDANDSLDILPEKFLTANLQSNASRQSFFLVAETDGKIIGCNGFLANDFTFNGVSYIGYQSCWSATDPHHRGKNIFTSIINEAKKILKEQGAGFLYGIANDVSNPIFKTKLDFAETDAVVLRIPNIPVYKYFYFTGKLQQNENTCSVNEEQVKSNKERQYPLEVKVIAYNNSWLWGKLVCIKKFGLKLTVFYVGGVCLSDEKDLPYLVSGVFKLKRVLFIQFFSCNTNTFNTLMKGWKKPKMNGFIFYNLNMPPVEHFNLMIGLIDIF